MKELFEIANWASSKTFFIQHLIRIVGTAENKASILKLNLF